MVIPFLSSVLDIHVGKRRRNDRTHGVCDSITYASRTQLFVHAILILFPSIHDSLCRHSHLVTESVKIRTKTHAPSTNVELPDQTKTKPGDRP